MAKANTSYELKIAKVEKFLNDEEPLKAIPHASNAIEIEPTNPQAYLLRSQCYRSIDYIMALADADQAIVLDPTDGEAFCNRGLLTFDADPVRARRDLERGKNGTFCRGDRRLFKGD